MLDVLMSQKDNAQINRYEHDDDLCAKRVVVVGGGEISMNIDASSITNAVKEGLKDIKIEAIELKEMSCNCKPEVQIVEKQVFIPSEPQVIHIKESIPVVSSVVQIVEVPVIVKEVEIKVVEVPVIVKEVQVIESPMSKNNKDILMKIIVIAQIIITVLLLTKK